MESQPTNSSTKETSIWKLTVIGLSVFAAQLVFLWGSAKLFPDIPCKNLVYSCQATLRFEHILLNAIGLVVVIPFLIYITLRLFARSRQASGLLNWLLTCFVGAMTVCALYYWLYWVGKLVSRLLGS
ncbi:hypothetical protein KBC99_00450 [Candidatus Saccharibacteria bacterium]|nr:hypothetical protein [Candidatus Saccharibacteria bacterium]